MATIRYDSQELDQYIKSILTEGTNHYDKPYKSERRIRDFVPYGNNYTARELIDLWNAHKKFPIRKDIPEIRLRTACHLIRQGIHHGIFHVTSYNAYISFTLSSKYSQYLHPRDGMPIFVEEEEIDLAEQVYEKATRRKIALATTYCINYILNHWTTMSGVDLDHQLGLSFNFPRVNSEEAIIAAAEAALSQMTVYRQLSWAAKVRVQMIRRMYLGDAVETDEDVDCISSLII